MPHRENDQCCEYNHHSRNLINHSSDDKDDIGQNLNLHFL